SRANEHRTRGDAGTCRQGRPSAEGACEREALATAVPARGRGTQRGRTERPFGPQPVGAVATPGRVAQGRTRAVPAGRAVDAVFTGARAGPVRARNAARDLLRRGDRPAVTAATPAQSCRNAAIGSRREAWRAG